MHTLFYGSMKQDLYFYRWRCPNLKAAKIERMENAVGRSHPNYSNIN